MNRMNQTALALFFMAIIGVSTAAFAEGEGKDHNWDLLKPSNMTVGTLDKDKAKQDLDNARREAERNIDSAKLKHGWMEEEKEN